MREFTKSMMSYTWAMSLFGVQQMLNLVTPQGQQQEHPATKAFNEVAGATEEQMGDILKSTYRAGDNVQRSAWDMMFSLFTFGMFNGNGSSRTSSNNRSSWTNSNSNIGQQSAEAMRQGMNVMGQAASAMTQGMYGAAAGAAAAAQQGGQGWGPTPGTGSAQSGANASRAWSDTGGSGGRGAGNGGGSASSSNRSEQQGQGWGPMPS